ncbi:MAG: hypothetical protein NZZ41_01230 [Candidatus Dojkabacteria bacterium]|nr:hypothetical protein [Candidatus Dojkabacteria bacterium]
MKKENLNIRELIKELEREKNIKVSTCDESLYTNISTFISTGCYSLNKILSGSYFRGIAHGRITAFVGLPGVGKSYVCKNIIREAQKLGYGIIVYDTENAYENQDLKRFGIDTSNIILPDDIITISQWRTSIVNLLKFFHEKDPDQKWLVVTDSIANLVTEKEIDESEEGGTSQDMGLRAKQFSSASRIIQKAISQYNAAMVITNHTYEKPAPNPNVPPTEVPKGGNAFIYMVSSLVGIKKYAVKEDIKNLVDNSSEKKKVGNRIVFTTFKNRFVPEGLVADAYIDFEKGLQPYHGLLEDAIKYGFIEKTGNRWNVKHLNKTIWTKDLYNDDVWVPILKDLDAKVSNDVKYSSYSYLNLTEEFENNLDEKTKNSTIND